MISLRSLGGLTAISTIVLGLELGPEWIVKQKNIALMIGALLTGLTTLMTFWNVEEYYNAPQKLDSHKHQNKVIKTTFAEMLNNS